MPRHQKQVYIPYQFIDTTEMSDATSTTTVDQPPAPEATPEATTTTPADGTANTTTTSAPSSATETPTETTATETPAETPAETTSTETPAETTSTETPAETTSTETPAETTSTETPTDTPTETQSETPTETPTDTPTETPSETPAETPTEIPSDAPQSNTETTSVPEDGTTDQEVDEDCEMLGSDDQNEDSSQGDKDMDETIASLHQMHLSALDSLKELSGKYSALATKQKEHKKTHNCCATVKRAKMSNQKIQELLEQVMSELKVQFVDV